MSESFLLQIENYCIHTYLFHWSLQRKPSTSPHSAPPDIQTWQKLMFCYYSAPDHLGEKLSNWFCGSLIIFQLPLNVSFIYLFIFGNLNMHTHTLTCCFSLQSFLETIATSRETSACLNCMHWHFFSDHTVCPGSQPRRVQAFLLKTYCSEGVGEYILLFHTAVKDSASFFGYHMMPVTSRIWKGFIK